MAHDPDDETLRAAQRASLGQVLLRAARLFDERALQRIRARPGAPPIRPAHARLFPFLRFGGVRATEMAERLGVTKQAVSPLVQDLVSWGIVEQVPDPADGRAQLVRWTEAGRHGMLSALEIFREVEAPWRAEVGDEVAERVHEALTTLVELLETNDG